MRYHVAHARRSPCGERGLKYLRFGGTDAVAVVSLPVRGAWIEILFRLHLLLVGMSLPVRGAWIEISISATSSKFPPKSLPVRGAWIEMLKSAGMAQYLDVAPRAGSVD